MAWVEGEKVGGYILGKQLGQGGMATVYLGHHPELDRKVAIKVMHQNFLEDEGFVARFKREAQIVAKLSHPHIVPVYDFSEHAGQPYLVMKYIQGRTLKRQLIKNPPDLEGVLDIMTAIGDALNYAHEQGILHRDIKPSNIVLEDDIPYLTDFGLARLVTSGESTMSADMLLGTPHYISPEQARGTASLDNRTDIYSLGIVLYELLVGKVPFTGDSAFSIIHDHIYTQLPAPTLVNPELPESVEQVLYKALEKQPKNRHETANALIEDLRRAIKQDNLTELNPERAVVAEASLAKIRAEYNDDPTTLHPLGVGSPMPQGSSMRKVKVYPQEKPFYDQPRFWVIGGCGSLILFMFMACGIILGMSSNIQELQALGFGENAPMLDSRIETFVEAVETFSITDEFGVTVTREDGVPILNLPYIPSDELPQDDNFVVSLLYARSFYEEGQANVAREVLVDNLPPDMNTRTLYLLSAANLSLESGDNTFAIISSILAARASEEQPFVGDNIQEQASRIIYNAAATQDDLNVRGTLLTLVELGAISENVVEELQSSPFAAFATARNQLATGNLEAADEILSSKPADGLLDSEFQLLSAELALALDKLDDAQGLLNELLDDDNAPSWVQSIVENTLNQLE